jgi:hypothetical protein
MLNKNFDSERGSKNRESDGRSWIEPLWTLISFLTLIALFPVSVEAQGTSAMAPAAIPASVYGGGVQAPLQFAGESLPANEVTLSMGADALYDDNVLSTSSPRVGDEAVSLNSHLGITRRSEHLAASFDYTPFFLLYRQFDQYDRLNHTAGLNLSGRLTSRTILGLHDTFGYENGMYPSLTGQQILSGLASPAGLNQMAIPYTTRTLTNVAGLDLTFEKSRRTSLTLSGDYSQRKFGQQTAGQLLYNSIGLGGSLTYQYSVTEHTSFGVLLVHQDTTYRGGQVFGYRLRTQIESTFLSLGSRLSPTVSVTVFGGPQYIRTVGQVAPGAVLSGHFQGSGGGSITKEVRKTAFDLAVQRSVSDGGGLYASAIYTNATLGVRRRLVGRWEAGLSAGAGQSDASLFRSGNGRTDTITGGVRVSRPLMQGSSFHIAYVTTHQVNKGALPILAKFDRDQVSIGIDYQFKALPLGQ